MTAKTTLAICLLGALGTFLFGCISNKTGEPVSVLLLIGPYGLLALLAWRYQTWPRVSKVLLALVVLLSALGLYAFGMDSYRYHAEPPYRLATRLVIYVSVLQLVVAVVTGVVLLGVDLVYRKLRPEGRA